MGIQLMVMVAMQAAKLKMDLSAQIISAERNLFQKWAFLIKIQPQLMWSEYMLTRQFLIFVKE